MVLTQDYSFFYLIMETFENKLALFDEYKALKEDLELLNNNSIIGLVDVKLLSINSTKSSKYIIQLMKERIKQLENILK